MTNHSGWLLWENTFETKFDAGIKFRKTLFYAHKSISLRPTFDDALYIKQRNQSITRIFKGTIETAPLPHVYLVWWFYDVINCADPTNKSRSQSKGGGHR